MSKPSKPKGAAPIIKPKKSKPAPTPKAQLGPEDWARAALAAIQRDGVQAVAVEPLAKILGVTKGSFYWHFTHRDALLAAALRLWEQEQSDDIVTRFQAIADPRRRLRIMMFAAFEDQENGLLHAALASSSEDERVQPTLRRVTETRMRFGIESFRSLGLGDEEALRRALFTYSAYAGYFLLLRAIPESVRDVSDLSAYVRYLANALLPEDLKGDHSPKSKPGLKSVAQSRK